MWPRLKNTKSFRAGAKLHLKTSPRPFASLEDLIENYIYGSAGVVGYFLTHVYGSHAEEDFGRAMAGARALGIALQLTNFRRRAFVCGRGRDERRRRDDERAANAGG